MSKHRAIEGDSSASSEMSDDGTKYSWHKVPVNEKLLRLNKRLLRSTGANEQLLPGLPNEITLDHITSKLPWNTFHILSSVNYSWLRAIRSHQVLEARVRSNSTETFIVLNEDHPTSEYILVLYSTRDKSRRYLPAIPAVPLRMYKAYFTFTSMEGKVYALGGEGHGGKSDGQVYVLDIAAGESLWKQCANILDRSKDRYASGVVDGKIYAFCGCGESNWIVDTCEVYDPHEDAWSPLEECPDRRFDYKVATIGKELFLYDGLSFPHEWDERSFYGVPDHLIKRADVLDIYNPNKDAWRRVESFMHEDDTVFMARGKFHRVSSLGIDVYDLDKNSWTLLHSNSFASIERLERATVKPVAALFANDEIVLLVYLRRRRRDNETMAPIVLQSIGFGCQNKVIVWETTNCRLSQFRGCARIGHCMCSIDL